MGHKLQMYENLRDMLECEIGEIERKHDLDKESLDNLYKLMMSLKVADRCIERNEMEEEMKKNGGQSMDYSYDGMSNARYRYSRDGQSMNMGTSNGGGYTGMGGYTYDGMSNAMYRDERSYDGMSNARRGRDGDSDGRYNESRDNFRDSQDRGWSNAEGNSYEQKRNTAKQKMAQKLATLMDDTMSEKERQAIQECMAKIENK